MKDTEQNKVNEQVKNNGNTNQNSGNEENNKNISKETNGDGNTNQNSGNEENNAIDYDKLETILKNATAKKEDIVLRDYLKQQGLTKEEIKKAVDDYKTNMQQQKEQKQQDITDLKTKYKQATKEVQDIKIELASTKAAIELGIDSKTLGYVLKMADLTKVVDKEGNINEENIKTALNQVLQDVPALKPVINESKGFQIGGLEQNTNKQQNNSYNIPKKKWNRFNY